jgi:hypothetical protein
VTGRSLALAQALVLVAAGVIVGITTYAVHTVTAGWSWCSSWPSCGRAWTWPGTGSPDPDPPGRGPGVRDTPGPLSRTPSRVRV